MGNTKRPNRKLQHEREKRGLSQAYIAEKLGTIEKTVSRWECGEQIPSPKYGRRLCKLFGKDAVELGFLEEAVEDEISEESAASNSSPASSMPSSGQRNSNASLQDITSPPTSISVPEGAAIFVVHNGTMSLEQIPAPANQIDVQSSNSAYSVEGVSPRQSPETPVIQGTESEDTVNRREAGKKIVSIGATLLTTPNLFGLMQVGTLLLDEEILSICAASIPICWRLYFDGQLSEVRRLLSGYISQLALLVRQPSGHQRHAASLASKAHQLACMLTLQEQDYGAALIHVDQALQSAYIADDANLKVASLIRKALAYRYINRYLKKCPGQILETYQEAVQYSSSVSPLLRGRLYTGLSEAYSELEQEYEAKHALEKAYKIFPEKPQDDPNFSFTHFKLPQGFEVVMYLNLKQASKAWEILAKIDTSVPMAVVPDRVELSIDQARASFLFGDMKLSCKYVEVAAIGAATLGSDLRYNEAYSIYRQMQMKWPREQQVKVLAGHFQ